jgi:hypothetical protein
VLTGRLGFARQPLEVPTTFCSLKIRSELPSGKAAVVDPRHSDLQLWWRFLRPWRHDGQKGMGLIMLI